MAVFLLGATASNGQALPITGPGVNPADFRVTTFASGLDFPMGMAVLDDGSLLVSVNDGVDFFNSTGQIIRLVDADADGVADAAPGVLANNLPGSLTGLAVAGDLVVTGGRENVMIVLRRGAVPSDPLVEEGRLLIDYGGSWLHRNSAVSVRPTPGQANQYDLLFQVGSLNNDSATTATATLSNTGIAGAAGTLAGDTAYMITLVDHGTHVSATNLTLLATGLRNAAGFAFHPVTGDLYLQDNGIDIPGMGPLSADELNLIPKDAIGGDVVEDFGFPASYVEYRTGTVVGGNGIQPLVVYQPIPDPDTGARSEGPNQLVVAPPGFPDGLNTGIFMGFHGGFSRGGLSNPENPLVYTDLDTGAYFHFVEPGQEGIGHLDGLHATRDSLFVAEFVKNGNLRDGEADGVIYMIKSLANPAPPHVRIGSTGAQIEIEWDRGDLMQSATLDGDWTPVPEACSPFLPLPQTGSQFYRAEY